MTVEELLDQVVDQETFVAFVRALADESATAKEMARNEPERYAYCSVLGWENSDISSFLFSCLEYFETGHFHRPEATPSWKMIAKFLYFGKIYE